MQGGNAVLSEAQYKKQHNPYSRLVLRSLGEGGREKTSSVFICSADYAVTSKWSVAKRLHKRPQGATSSTFAQGYGGQASKSSPEFGEDVKKRLRLLSEVVLRTVKRRLTSSFRHFFAKKWRLEFLSSPRYSEQRFELKNSEFRCEIKF